MVLTLLWFCLVSAAAFFVTYECTKSLLRARALSAPHMEPVTHMIAASMGEIVRPLLNFIKKIHLKKAYFYLP